MFATSDKIVGSNNDRDDEAVLASTRFENIPFGLLHTGNWQEQARKMPKDLVPDCRGVHDAPARSSPCHLGLEDKKSGLEAPAIKQSLMGCER